MRASWVPAFLCVAVLFPKSGNAQPDKVPEPVPLVTAANADWQMRGEPIFYAGNFYWPSGPTIFFDGAVLVRTGQYDGVPLYADPFLQPNSVVYVPIGGNVVRPYVRRQAGPGTVGPMGGPNAYVAPNLEPLVIPESAGTGTPGAVGTGGSIVPRPATGVETLAIERGRTARTAVRSISRPARESRHLADVQRRALSERRPRRFVFCRSFRPDRRVSRLSCLPRKRRALERDLRAVGQGRPPRAVQTITILTSSDPHFLRSSNPYFPRSLLSFVSLASSVSSKRGVFGLPRPVWLLGWVSLATDAASEAIYPLLPFFLTHVLGAGAVALGIVEGGAEAANSLLKIVSGRLADRGGAKRRLVLFGYSISSAARPLISLATSWTQVFAIRTTDRVGKGIRGAPRDAMLANWATQETRGKVYGFHRAMDHAGAVVGPLLASLFLLFYPGQYRTLFTLTVIPGAIAVALIFRVPETENLSNPSNLPNPNPANAANPSNLANLEQGLPKRFKWFMAVLALFMLGNSTDAFLLLRITDVAGKPAYAPLAWAAIHVVKATVSVIGGSWSDRVGRRAVIALGWITYAVVYAGFAVSTTLSALLIWFMIYGLYFGFAEGTEKALVADLAPASKRGMAFGIYNAVSGIGALTASVIFGVIWNRFGASVAFATGAALALLASALLFVVVPKAAPRQS